VTPLRPFGENSECRIVTQMRVEQISTFVTRLAGHSVSPENCGLTLAHLDFSHARSRFRKIPSLT